MVAELRGCNCRHPHDDFVHDRNHLAVSARGTDPFGRGTTQPREHGAREGPPPAGRGPFARLARYCASGQDDGQQRYQAGQRRPWRPKGPSGQDRARRTSAADRRGSSSSVRGTTGGHSMGPAATWRETPNTSPPTMATARLARRRTVTTSHRRSAGTHYGARSGHRARAMGDDRGERSSSAKFGQLSQRADHPSWDGLGQSCRVWAWPSASATRSASPLATSRCITEGRASGAAVSRNRPRKIPPLVRSTSMS